MDLHDIKGKRGVNSGFLRTRLLRRIGSRVVAGRRQGKPFFPIESGDLRRVHLSARAPQQDVDPSQAKGKKERFAGMQTRSRGSPALLVSASYAPLRFCDEAFAHRKWSVYETGRARADR